MIRMENGREFQIIGAENEKDLRSMTLLMLGTSSKLVLDDLRVFMGLYGCRRFKR